jgi:hypothetical protein
MPQLYAIIPVGNIDAPIDPGFGRPGGGAGHPDHDLPGRPPRPDHGLPWVPSRPGHGLPGDPNLPVHPGNRPPGSGMPDRPEHGLPEGPPVHPWLPGFISQRPDQSLPLPPVDGVEPPPAGSKPPVGIWPPLPPSVPPGLHAILVWISGLGYRYAIVDVSAHPDQGLPPGAAPKPA